MAQLGAINLKNGFCDVASRHVMLQNVLQKEEDDLGSVKAYGASVTAQRNSLRMVPSLSGVINF